MKEIIILVGCGRAGKTTYALKIAKEKGYEYLTIDGNYHYTGEEEYFRFVDFIANTLNKNPSKNFILDGYLDFDDHFKYLKNKLKHHKIKPVLVFTNYEVIQSRGPGGAGIIHSAEHIIGKYKNFPKVWDFEEFVEGDGNNKKVKTYEEAIKIVENITEQDVKNFLKKFEEKNLEKYQTIELPFGYKIQGYNQDYEHKSWEQISEIYDFKNKKVADIGCFNGYFCFEIKKSAKTVHGFDKKISAIETAREITKLKELDIKFEVFDLDKGEIKEEYDVILLLNTWQHLKNIEEDFNKIFSKTKAVILEMGFVKLKPHWSMISKEKLLEIAEKYNHKLRRGFVSARGRTILLFEK